MNIEHGFLRTDFSSTPFRSYWIVGPRSISWNQKKRDHEITLMKHRKKVETKCITSPRLITCCCQRTVSGWNHRGHRWETPVLRKDCHPYVGCMVKRNNALLSLVCEESQNQRKTQKKICMELVNRHHKY